jgi:hypothetical protein
MGQEPVCWVLFTSLPIDTHEALAKVGYYYELRWRIEEFFHLLKSGYGIEKTRLENADKVGKLLVLLAIVSVFVVNLKTKLGLPSKGVLDEESYSRVKQAIRTPNNREIDFDLRLFGFIAAHGGWLGRRRDPIGPGKLMRGMSLLIFMMDAAERYGELIEEARQNRDAIRRLLCV